MPIIFAAEGAFTWLSLLPFLEGKEQFLPLAHSTFAAILILILAWLARMAMMRVRKGREGLIPEANLKPRNFFELYTEAILNMCRGILGKDAEFYFPLIAGLFLYIFVSNLLGVFPGFLPPTDQLNTNLPMALAIFVIYNIAGVIRQGPVEYAKHFMGPVIWLAPLFIFVEIISHLVRPASLSIRLYGNMVGDHTVLDIFLNVLPTEMHMALGYVVPVPFLALGIFVSFIQAFVFSLLSTLYIGLAVAHDH
ncbi:MAG: F0F1 ATP synthase subunit A [Myxococcota bacterium]|nr:F0F1 ATP synthase subunit A [Myxococcota bacterium]